MPEGSSGLDPNAWMAEWVTQGTGLSGLAGRTQDAISEYYQGQALGSPSWQQAANNFFQNILGGFGDLGTFLELVVESLTGTPGALTDLQAFIAQQWSSLADSLSWLTDIGVLIDTFFKFLAGTKTQADLDAAWIAVCTDFGITSPNWTTFWDSVFEQYVSPTGTFAPADWSKRLTNDLTILFDVFHWTYQAGTASDPPGHLGTNGKATWYSAWNDLLSLVGIVNSTTAPTVTAPTIGESIQANTAASSIAGTNASLAIATNQSVIDQVNQAMTGVTTLGQPVTSILGNLTAIPAGNIVGNQGATVTWGATGASNSSSLTNPASTSWSHTPAPTDTSVDVIIFWYGGSGATSTPTVTYGGAAMTRVNTITGSAVAGNIGTIQVWRIAVTPTGSPSSATVAVSISQSTGTAAVRGNSLSYSGVKVNYSGTYTGGTTAGANSLAMSMSSAADKRVIAAYGVQGIWGSTVPTFGGFTGGTQRTSLPATSQLPLFFLGDAAGAASTAFGITCTMPSGSSGVWCGLIIEISN